MIVYDAHAHAGDEAELGLRRQLGLCTMLSCGNPQQAKAVQALCAASPVLSMTAGIHPWYAEHTRLEEMLPFMESAVLVGEIGLDSVWCETPMRAQQTAFSRQLDWAAANSKGIVLHTKGCEAEIARRVDGFPHPVIVHWYSGSQDALEHFLAQGCYFTIGPDIAVNPAVQAVARLAPDDRILFETDGMDAVRWAIGHADTADLPHILEGSVRAAAALRGQDAQRLCEAANKNYRRLTGMTSDK